VAFGTGPIPTENEFPCRTLVACLEQSNTPDPKCHLPKVNNLPDCQSQFLSESPCPRAFNSGPAGPKRLPVTGRSASVDHQLPSADRQPPSVDRQPPQSFHQNARAVLPFQATAAVHARNTERLTFIPGGTAQGMHRMAHNWTLLTRAIHQRTTQARPAAARSHKGQPGAKNENDDRSPKNLSPGVGAHQMSLPLALPLIPLSRQSPVRQAKRSAALFECCRQPRRMCARAARPGTSVRPGHAQGSPQCKGLPVAEGQSVRNTHDG